MTVAVSPAPAPVLSPNTNGAVVSFFYGFFSTLAEALPLLHVAEKPDALADYPPDTPVGVYKTASTEKDYQKLGICSSFIRDLEPVLRERGAKLILATALRPLGREVPMRHIFRDNGFEAAAEISRPWVDMLLYCPYCKKNHCICDAVFYMKKLDETEGKCGE